MRIIKIHVLIGILFLLGGCAASLSRDGLGEMRENPAIRPVIIDVRSETEYNRGHIPLARHISVWSLPFRLSEVADGDKARAVVVYCAHGPRAGLAGFFLKISGFKAVFSLQGHMAGWLENGGLVEGGR
ncbi:MAG: rhodanese-like domain-containing protein [Proteobacteria bacterium]|nr:rhodanese-like domain-containing protein [Pseudomonadota bacterium]MBU1688705.1 rhodanese-like domain-containing protein [Pseudomonadota bacterium]